MTDSYNLTIDPEHPSLTGHFPGEPIVPGAILLDHAISYVERASERRVSAIAVAKFIVPVRPRQIVVISIEKTDRDRVSLIGAVADVKVLTATMILEDRVNGH
jgi:3-hydroxymyristoyl/3-hydroxydecanoyl-(acyl carrier protein) dehydratase